MTWQINTSTSQAVFFSESIPALRLLQRYFAPNVYMADGVHDTARLIQKPSPRLHLRGAADMILKTD